MQRGKLSDGHLTYNTLSSTVQRGLVAMKTTTAVPADVRWSEIVSFFATRLGGIRTRVEPQIRREYRRQSRTEWGRVFFLDSDLSAVAGLVHRASGRGENSRLAADIRKTEGRVQCDFASGLGIRSYRAPSAKLDYSPNPHKIHRQSFRQP